MDECRSGWECRSEKRVTVNFLGENWCTGEMTLSLKIFFQYLRSWIFLLIRERKRRKVRKEAKHDGSC